MDTHLRSSCSSIVDFFVKFYFCFHVYTATCFNKKHQKLKVRVKYFDEYIIMVDIEHKTRNTHTVC